MSKSTTHSVVEFVLESLSGPTSRTFELRPPGPLRIGRRASHELPLTGDDHVSRDHALLTYLPSGRLTGATTVIMGARSSGQWAIIDTGSKHGTWINGARLPANQPCPLRHADIVAIAPWTFRFVDRTQARISPVSRENTVDDADATGVRRVSRVDSALGGGKALAQQRVDLLLDCAAAIHASENVSALAEAVLDAAVRGAGFANAGVLGPLSEDGSIEIIAKRGGVQHDGGGLRISRSLLREASAGDVVRTEGGGSSDGYEAHSIVQYGISEALCVPLTSSGAVMGFLYLDNRGSPGRVAGDAVEFATCLGRLAALAMSNLTRRDLEVRFALLQRDIDNAAAAQQFILPAREGVHGALRYVGESRAGRTLGGDFFDIIPLEDGRLGVALGDVAGKGFAASILMTTSQGFLHAALTQHGDPARAVSDLNAFLSPRCTEGKFLTLWVGVFDPSSGELVYVDGGHGYALVRRQSGGIERLNLEGGFPLGLEAKAHYGAAHTRFEPGDMAIVVSDGMIEQPGLPGPDGSCEQFGIENVSTRLAEAGDSEDVVAALFDAVERHAGGSSGSVMLADDATAVVVRR